jgi:hypothetical protein
MRAPAQCLLALSVLASACRSGLHAPAGKDAGADAGISDSGTSRETASAGP